MNKKKGFRLYWGKLQSGVKENLIEFCQIFLKILPYLTDFSPQLMACMLIANSADPDQTWVYSVCGTLGLSRLIGKTNNLLFLF